MEDHQQKLASYIQQQLQSGQTPNEITEQLRGGGWKDHDIHAAFTHVQSSIMPTSLASHQSGEQVAASTGGAIPQANAGRRGRIRTGWQLFKQSMTVLNGNRYLLRYLFMTGAWVFGITIVFAFIYAGFDHLAYQMSDNTYRYVGWLLTFIDYLVVYFFVNLYAAGLTANVLDLFQGNRKSYQEYMQLAWSKAGPILAYSAIEASVGVVLRYIAERFRWAGLLISWLLGTLWSLGTLFVIPLIVTSPQPSGVRSIKDSVKFFKHTWGENITAKVSVNTPLFFMNLLAMVVFLIGFFSAVSGEHWVTAYAFLIAYLVVILVLAIVGSFANSLVNIALFYFAASHKVPPAFSEDMLNQVFVQRKGRLFKRGARQQAAV